MSRFGWLRVPWMRCSTRLSRPFRPSHSRFILRIISSSVAALSAERTAFSRADWIGMTTASSTIVTDLYAGFLRPDATDARLTLLVRGASIAFIAMSMGLGIGDTMLLISPFGGRRRRSARGRD